MTLLRNNMSTSKVAVDKYIGTSYDTIKTVYDNLTQILTAAAAVDDGSIADTLFDIDIERQTGSQAVARLFTFTTITYGIALDNISVYRNGQRLDLTEDYTEPSATTLLLTFDPNAGDKFVFITNERTDTANIANASNVSITPLGVGAIATTVQAMLRVGISVGNFGAAGDSLTDDLAAFDLAVTASNTFARSLFIPPLTGQNFYKLSDVWRILSRDNIEIYGAGPASAIVSYNEAGANVMEIEGSRLGVYRDFSLNGIVGGGNGLVIKEKISSASPSHFNRFSGIVLQRFDGDCLVLESGQSCTFTDIRCEDGISGISIPVLTGAKVAGTSQRAIYVKSDSSGNTNNASFVNCVINNCYGDGATDYALQVGTATAESVGSFVWLGGLIQGGDSNLVYLQCLDGAIKDCHIEASISATKYEITFKNCTDTYITGGHGQGDVLFDGANIRCGLINRKANGVNISSTSREILIDGVSLQNAGNGPSGKFIDLGADTKVVRCVGGANGSAIRYTVGDILTGARIPWMVNSMENWRGGATPTLPGGFGTFDPRSNGGMTVSRETTTVLTGAYSIKQVTTTANHFDYEQGSSFFLTPVDDAMRYLITARVYVSVGSASLRLWIDSGASTSDYACVTTGQWVKLQMTVTPDSDGTIEVILAAGKSSTVFWDSLSVVAEDYTPKTFMTLNDVATIKLGPSLDGGGYHIPTYLATGTVTMTSIVGAFPGVPFRLIFDGNKTVTDNTDIVLNGGGNFAATATDSLTLVLDEATGKHVELGRSVN